MARVAGIISTTLKNISLFLQLFSESIKRNRKLNPYIGGGFL